MKTTLNGLESKEWDALVFALKYFIERVRTSEDWKTEEEAAAKRIAAFRESEKRKGKS